MYYTHRGESNKRLIDLRQSTITGSDITSELDKKLASTQTQTNNIYTSTESVNSNNCRPSHREKMRICEEDLEKFVKSKSLRTSIINESSQQNKESIKRKDLFKYKAFLIKSADGRTSIDRHKIIVKKSLIQQYKKSQGKSTKNLVKMYNQFVKKKESYISVNQINPPSTLDLRTPKQAIEETKEQLEIHTEINQVPLSTVHKGINHINSCHDLILYRQKNTKFSKHVLDNKNIDKVFKNIKKLRRPLWRNNNNHLRHSRNSRQTPKRKQQERRYSNQVKSHVNELLNSSNTSKILKENFDEDVLNTKISIKEVILLLLSNVDKEKLLKNKLKC